MALVSNPTTFPELSLRTNLSILSASYIKSDMAFLAEGLSILSASGSVRESVANLAILLKSSANPFTLSMVVLKLSD